MNKIKEKLNKILELSKILIHKYPVTVFAIAITTLLVTIGIDSDIDGDFMQVMVIFLISYFASAFFIESVFTKNTHKIISFCITGLISAFFGIYFNNFVNIPEFWMLLYIGYLFTLVLIGIYNILKNSRLSFQEYVLNVFSNMFFVSIIYGILAIGITLISLIFIELILDGDYDEIVLRANLLVFGFYYVVGCVYAVTNVNGREINVFIKNLVKFVLMPLIGIAMAIIYLYILKIFITGEMPSNVIFRICAFLFVYAFPVWNMYEVIKDNKISKIFSYAYVPLLLLEIYSLGIRIFSLGITPIRYVGIFFIVFQIVALLLSFCWNKEKLPKLIVCSTCLIAIITMTPFTPSKVSEFDQLSRLTRYFPENTNYTELSIDAQRKVASAYKYVFYEGDSNSIPAYIKNQSEDILNFNDEESSNYYNNRDYYFYTVDERINVEGFKYATKVYGDKNDNGYYVFSDNNKHRYEIPENVINDFVGDLVERGHYNEKSSSVIENPYIRQPDFTLFIIDIYLYYDKDIEKVEGIKIEGYILE